MTFITTVTEDILKQAKILIIDDEKANVRLLEVILQHAGFPHVHSTTDSRQALSLFLSVEPDLVLLDLSMPHLDGFAVMQQLPPEMIKAATPILILTADATRDTRHKALKSGAKDFLTKPLDESEVLLRINNLLVTRFYGLTLEARVQERTRELEEAQNQSLEHMRLLEDSQAEMLGRLAQAAEYRDDDTGHHTYRVGRISGLVAKSLGLPDHQVDLIRRAAPLHDVGKIGISDAILLKKGPLTSEEFVKMKTHTHIGANLLANGHSKLVKVAHLIALTHHERWDGTGYPRQLKGEQIPIEGRIVAIADVFDALTHERPYKRAWSMSEALAEIEGQSGRQFDARIVKALLTLPPRELTPIHEALGETKIIDEANL